MRQRLAALALSLPLAACGNGGSSQPIDAPDDAPDDTEPPPLAS